MSGFLFCPDCDIKLHFPELLCLYWLGPEEQSRSYRSGQWVRVLMTPIWCAACNCPSLAERIPSEHEFDIAAGLRRLEDQEDLGSINDELLTLSDEEFSLLANGLRGRKRIGRCLLCHGRSYLPLALQHDYPTNLRHEDCGGRLRYQEWFMHSWYGPRKVQWYNFAGELLENQDDRF